MFHASLWYLCSHLPEKILRFCSAVTNGVHTCPGNMLQFISTTFKFWPTLYFRFWQKWMERYCVDLKMLFWLPRDVIHLIFWQRYLFLRDNMEFFFPNFVERQVSLVWVRATNGSTMPYDVANFFCYMTDIFNLYLYLYIIL